MSSPNITGTFVLPSGSVAQYVPILFKPLSTPFIYGAAIVTTQSITTTTDVNGQIAVTLNPGAYKVIVNNGTDTFNIQVPDDSGLQHDIFSVISSTIAATGPASSPQVYTVDKLATVLTDSRSIKWTRNADYDAANTSFVFLGNYGDAAHTANLSSSIGIINTLMPAAVFGLGNNNYATTPRAAGSYDNIIGQFFHSYLYPYTGGYGAASSTGNRFWPAIGAYDAGNIVGSGFSYSDYLAYFSGAISFGQRSGEYYTITKGDVQFFVLNSDKNATDGYTAASVQGVWLQTQLAASTATWKIVCFYQSPYSSVSGYANTWMRWPFDIWGADAVISSGVNAYERFEINGVYYFTVGLMSKTADSFGAILPNSFAQDNTHPGVLSLQASDYALNFSYVDTGGVTRDSVQVLSVNTPNEIFAHVPVDPYGGLYVGPNGVAMKIPNVVIGQVVTPNPYVLNYGQIIISDTPPDVIANPLYAKCVWLQPGAISRLYLWNANLNMWVSLLDSAQYSPTPVPTQLPQLTFTPAAGGSRAAGISIGNITTGATVYFSIDGGAFAPLTGTTVYFPFVTTGYLGVYQALTGNLPSAITYGQFTA